MNAFLRRAVVLAALVPAIGFRSVPRAAAQTPAQATFASPEDAVAALHAAVKVHDKAALRVIFGPGIRELLRGDDVLDKAESQSFAKAIEEGANPVADGDGRLILEIGAKKWPFPVPLVKEGSAWRFDTAAGKEEILDRHVGKDELHAIGACAAYVRARKQGGAGEASPPKPRHGYRFKFLARTGAAAPGGFALAAYPEHWGRSGIMTFIVAEDGRIYQRDLGKKTARKAAAMTDYNPDGDWTPVKDAGLDED